MSSIMSKTAFLDILAQVKAFNSDERRMIIWHEAGLRMENDRLRKLLAEIANSLGDVTTKLDKLKSDG